MKKLLLILLVVILLISCDLDPTPDPEPTLYKLNLIFSVNDIVEWDEINDELVITKARGMDITILIGAEEEINIYVPDTYYLHTEWIKDRTLIFARNKPDPIEHNASLSASIDGISIGGSNKPGEVIRTWHFDTRYSY